MNNACASSSRGQVLVCSHLFTGLFFREGARDGADGHAVRHACDARACMEHTSGKETMLSGIVKRKKARERGS